MFLFLWACCTFAGTFAKENHNDYQLLQINFSKDEQGQEITDMENKGDLDLWSMNRLKKSAVTLVSPEKLKKVRKSLRSLGVKISVKDRKVETDTKRMSRGRLKSIGNKYFPNGWWMDYHNLEEINDKMEELASLSKDASFEYIGMSFEGRKIPIVKVCQEGCKDKKPAIFIQGGIHAREWISPPAVLYFLKELLTNEENADLISKLDWYFVANVNPDGYAFTWEGGGNRFWRKTRSTSEKNPHCLGVDGNRNFDYCWSDKGSSRDPCSETYHGPSVFSENEVTDIANFLKDHTFNSSNGIKFFSDIHAYGQMILLPFGIKNRPNTKNGCGIENPHFDEILEKTKKWSKALTEASDTNLEYTIGRTPDILYEVSGASNDYTLGVLGIKYSFCLELRPEQGSSFGFAPLPSQILPAAKESWAFHRAAAKDIIEEYAE